MAPDTPYTPQLEGQDPLVAMRSSVARFETLSARPAGTFDRPYAPEKWTGRQILVHLAQTELALGNRARLALSTPNYTCHSFTQDAWLPLDSSLDAKTALRALTALIMMNLAMYERLTDAQRQTPFGHPEYGSLTVDWVLYQQAGHHIHHLKQLAAME
jgi:DinB superfamily